VPPLQGPPRRCLVTVPRRHQHAAFFGGRTATPGADSERRPRAPPNLRHQVFVADHIVPPVRRGVSRDRRKFPRARCTLTPSRCTSERQGSCHRDQGQRAGFHCRAGRSRSTIA
jgi:hypothetical protein